jgi:hypothetical protein
MGSTSSQASTIWTRVRESNLCGAGSLALANHGECTTTSPHRLDSDHKRMSIFYLKAGEWALASHNVCTATTP